MNRIHCAIQEAHQIAAGREWLTPAERARLDGFRFEKRRRDWLLGRWTAKIALLKAAGLSPEAMARFEIESSPDGVPLPRLDGRPYPARLSLSHSHDRAFAAVLPGDPPLGCDIELVEPRSPGFVDTFFTAAERERVECAGSRIRDTLVTTIWSAKESTLKALGTGLKADTRSVEVIPDVDSATGGWGTARTVTADDGEFHCLWRRDGRSVLTVVTREPAVVSA